MAHSGDSVRSLIRGLEVLRFLNTMGAARAAAIALELDIPRPTVYRLLGTLEEAGYVAFSATDSRARVTPLAASLGDNSAARSRLCQVAAPIMAKLTDMYTWPIDLCTYDNMHMVVQETTHGKSALSIDTNMSGFPLPMLRSSAGRAYLANCSDSERKHILELLREERLVEDVMFLSPAWIDTNLAKYKAQGFATRDPRTYRPKTASIAAPIVTRNGVAGSLSIIWISKAISMSEGKERYAKPLQRAAEKIVREYQTEQRDCD